MAERFAFTRALLALPALALLATGVPRDAVAAPSIVVDMASGQVIESEEAHKRWYPASLTKVMTAYVAFRAIAAGEVTLESPVRISKKAASEPPSKMGYPAGSVLTLDNALKIIMVKSANDVATAIGESIAGSQAAFAARMNAESRRLGMTGSNWVNAHGLHSDDQYSTARDLALLGLAIKRDFPQHASYFRLEGIVDGKARMPNHNDLIGRFEGADGMKTGYTCPSGYNLIATANRDGRGVLAVVIGAESTLDRLEKAAALLTKGFAFEAPSGPRLIDLPRRGDDLDVAINLRPSICTEAARKARVERAKALESEARKAAGESTGSVEDIAQLGVSPFLRPLGREPVYVAVGLGGATGPKSPFALDEVEYANVPIPTPRPDYTPAGSGSR